MDIALCDISAFYLYRVPPLLREGLVEGVSLDELLKRKPPVSARPLLDALPAPLHVLVDTQSARHKARGVARHCVTGDRPSGSLIELAPDLHITDPRYTLFLLARKTDPIVLAMMMYEMVGSFAIYAPRSEYESAALESLSSFDGVWMSGEWKPLRRSDGSFSALWKRSPLVEYEEMDQYVRSTKGMYGHANFERAWNLVYGNAASPFEVQAAMLIGLPRRLGGEGFENLSLNAKIDFNATARAIAGRRYCLCDLLLDGGDGTCLDIECQSALIHENGESYLRDADRQLALRSMGIDFLPLTYGQISDAGRFCNAAHAIANEQGMKLSPKSKGLKDAEHELRRKLFIDWATLGL